MNMRWNRFREMFKRFLKRWSSSAETMASIGCVENLYTQVFMILLRIKAG